MMIVGIVGGYTKLYGGLPFREVATINTSLLSRADGGDGGNMVPQCAISDPAVKALFLFCNQDKRGNVKYALLGDSKAHSLYPGLVRSSTDHGRWMFIGGSGKHGAPVPLLHAENEKSNRLTLEAVNAIANAKEIETVVITSAVRALFALNDGVKSGDTATYDYDYLKTLKSTTRLNAVFDQFNRTVSRLVKSGKNVIIVVDNPALPNPEDCIGRQTSLAFINMLLDGQNAECYVSLTEFKDDTAIYRKLLDRIESLYPGQVRIFDPTEIYCDLETGVCPPIRNGRLLYSYTDHISDFASGLVGYSLNKFIERE